MATRHTGLGRAAVAPPAGSGHASLPHRPELDGLRAVAVLLVVGYHANVAWFSAGFLGVDIFFVLSGFLITRLIVHEVDETGSLHLGRFWLRRARRLVPAAAAMVAVVLVAGQWVESPLRWKATIGDGLASLAYWSNQRFAEQAVDYFGGALETSPLLHTWSLAVEEQFYLLWPVVFFLVARFAGGSARARAVRVAAVAGVTAASLALSVHLVAAGSAVAFFSAASRAWEFGAGALLALASGRLDRLGRPARQALGALGAFLLLAALATTGPSTPFPGRGALLPVAASVALIVAGRAGPFGRLLAARPLRRIGGLSYSWYLWHWPAIVLGTQVVGYDNVGVRLALSGAALVAAELSRRLIEDRVRHSPALARSWSRSVAVLAAVSLTAAGTAGVMSWQTKRSERDPLLQALHDARRDHVALTADCASLDAAVVASGCAGGDPAGRSSVLVLGDSHAAHWMPAVDAAGRRLGLRMAGSVLGNCPALDVVWARQPAACDRRQAGIGRLIDDLDPDVVVVSHSLAYVGGLIDADGRRLPAGEQGAAWQAGLTRLARQLQARDTELLVILDVPRFAEDVLDCVARARSAAGCATPEPGSTEALTAFHRSERAALTAAGHGTIYDPLPLICPDGCSPIIDGAVIYTDGHHLTGAFARSLSPHLSEVLGPLG